MMLVTSVVMYRSSYNLSIALGQGKSLRYGVGKYACVIEISNVLIVDLQRIV